MDLATLAIGGKRALAKALALVEARENDPALVSLLDAAYTAPRGRVIGLTGPPGVGKSSLIDAVLRGLRARGLTVGVIAVDPSSRTSGGALLGDRTRMARDPADEGVFVRSMAARDRLGGLADLVFPAMVLMRAVRDIVLVETVGVGQSETAIAEIADRVVFCAQPGAGDSLQFMKAGVMEIPDLVVVTKADMGAPARQAVADLKGALSLVRQGDEIGVLSCSATTGEGIDAVVEALLATPVDAGLRARQGRAWMERTLRDRFGSEGIARIAGALTETTNVNPFRESEALSGRLTAALTRVT